MAVIFSKIVWIALAIFLFGTLVGFAFTTFIIKYPREWLQALRVKAKGMKPHLLIDIGENIVEWTVEGREKHFKMTESGTDIGKQTFINPNLNLPATLRYYGTVVPLRIEKPMDSKELRAVADISELATIKLASMEIGMLKGAELGKKIVGIIIIVGIVIIATVIIAEWYFAGKIAGSLAKEVVIK